MKSKATSRRPQTKRILLRPVGKSKLSIKEIDAGWDRVKALLKKKEQHASAGAS